MNFTYRDIETAIPPHTADNQIGTSVIDDHFPVQHILYLKADTFYFFQMLLAFDLPHLRATSL